MSWVGASIKRREDPALIRGVARFTADEASTFAAVAFVRSPFAAGTIRDIEMPHGDLGGISIFTGRDLEAVSPLMPLLDRPDYVPVPQPVLATRRVSYVGEPVAMVIAATREAAEDVADQVFVDIDDEEPVIGLDVALDGARYAHPDLGFKRRR